MHVPTPKWEPLVLGRIIEPFMTGTIQELYHIGLVPKSMIYHSTVQDTECIGADGDALDGNKRCL